MSTLRFAASRLRRTPLVAGASVLILSVAIGANTAMFTIVNSLLLQRLPFKESERLVIVSEARPGVVGDGLVSLSVFSAWRLGQDLVRLAAYTQAERVLTGAEPMQAKTASVSANLFQLLGEPLALGRSFTTEEDDFGAPRALILRHALWQTRFGGDPRVIGRTLSLDGEHYRVVGITRPAFDFPEGAQLWTPLLPSVPREYLGVATWKFLHVLGRLERGVSLEHATDELSALASSAPGNSGWAARVTRLHEAVTADVRRPLLVLMGAVVLVLLIACANVANLLIARGVARGHELAVRAALGSSRARIARDLLSESFLIAVIAGVLGTLVAWQTLNQLTGLIPRELTAVAVTGVAMDGRVLAFAVGATLFTGVAAGCIPALRSGRVDIVSALSDGSRQGTSHGPVRLRAGIVAGEVALSLVLLTGAGLLIRGLFGLVSVDPGFQAERITAFEIRPPAYKYQWPSWYEFFHELTARVRAMPGVLSVATARSVPLDGNAVRAPIVVAGREAEPTNLPAQTTAVSPRYFSTMGIRFIAGRDFEERDELGTVPVAIVSQTFARSFFPGENPVGKKARPFFGGSTMREIIGVVEDVRLTDLASKPEPTLYTVAAHQASGPLILVVRSAVSAQTLVRSVQSIVRNIDQDQPISSVATMDEMMARSIARPRLYAILLGGFASIAVALALLGLYAVMSQVLAQSRQEMAVRMAIGATGGDVFRLLLGRGMQLVLVGAAAGVAVALGATRALSTLLFGVRATDPITFLVASGIILGSASLAISVNAWRAARADPMSSLRS